MLLIYAYTLENLILQTVIYVINNKIINTRNRKKKISFTTYFI